MKTLFIDIGIYASPCLSELTHLPLGKMAAILADHIFKYIFLNENVCIFIRISLKYVPMGQIINMPALGQTMAWRRTGIIWTNAGLIYWRIYVSLSLNELKMVHWVNQSLWITVW